MENTAQKWLNRKEWKDGLKIDVHPSVEAEEFYTQFYKRPDLWKASFAFLRDNDLSKIKPGKYTIVGDEVFAVVQEYESRKPEDACWESHKKYIDLQYVIFGNEKMGIIPLSEANNSKPYNEENDIQFYGKNIGRYYLANPHSFFLFFPKEVHRPGLQTEHSMKIKKVVVKILNA